MGSTYSFSYSASGERDFSANHGRGTASASATGAPAVALGEVMLGDATPAEDPPGYNQALRDSEAKQQEQQFTRAEQALLEDRFTYLREHRYPVGLANVVATEIAHRPYGVRLEDNSGSMGMPRRGPDGKLHNDGVRLVWPRGSRTPRALACLPWEELKQTELDHARLAGGLRLPTEFRLLNPNGRLSHVRVESAHDVKQVEALLRPPPKGSTPLADRVRDIIEVLAAEGGADADIPVVISTDGLPTFANCGHSTPESQADFLQALHELAKVCNHVVIRLCTNDPAIRNYYNDLDVSDADGEQLLKIDILDDLFGEAEEVHETNPIFTYGPPLHQARGLPLPNKLFDDLDEYRFSLKQTGQFCQLLLGGAALPDPAEDPAGFLAAVHERNDEKTYDPISKHMKPWIDEVALEARLRDELGDWDALSSCSRSGSGRSDGALGGRAGRRAVGGARSESAVAAAAAPAAAPGRRMNTKLSASAEKRRRDQQQQGGGGSGSRRSGGQGGSCQCCTLL